MEVIQRWKVAGALHNLNGIHLYAKVPYGQILPLLLLQPIFCHDRSRQPIVHGQALRCDGAVQIIVTGVFGFHGFPNVEEIPNRRNKECGIRLILAPKSAKAFFTAKVFPYGKEGLLEPWLPLAYGSCLKMDRSRSSSLSLFCFLTRDGNRSLRYREYDLAHLKLVFEFSIYKVWKSVGYGVSMYWIRRIGDFLEHGYAVSSLMDTAYWSSEQ
ncbi:hypothetical protein Tco_0775434 [Tanacetum coccineum]